MWECQQDNICKAYKLPTSRADLEYLKPLIPRDVYFGGHTNACCLYHKCTGIVRDTADF